MCRPSTAEVDVNGQSVSVYIADTVKRIWEANRHLEVLGSSRRYQLKDPNSNRVILLVNEQRPPPPPPVDADGAANDAVISHSGWASTSEAPMVVKSLPLRQFMTALGRLRSQAAAHRRQEAGQPRPLPRQYDHLHLCNPPSSEYDVLELHAEPTGEKAGDVEEQLASATRRCEELALQVHLLRHAELAV
jgi:hypothetical protein